MNNIEALPNFYYYKHYTKLVLSHLFIYPFLYPSVNLLFLVHLMVDYRYLYPPPKIFQYVYHYLSAILLTYGFFSFDAKLT